MGELEACRNQVEDGICTTLGLPKPGPIAYITAPTKHMVWLSLRSSTCELYWATLEQKRGRPVTEGTIAAADIVSVLDNGAAVEVHTKSRSRPIILEFDSA